MTKRLIHEGDNASHPKGRDPVTLIMAGQVLDKEERGYLDDLKPLQNTHVQSSIHKYPQTLGLPLTRSGTLDRVSRPGHQASLSQLDSSAPGLRKWLLLEHNTGGFPQCSLNAHSIGKWRCRQ